jgi:hypothetical protein
MGGSGGAKPPGLEMHRSYVRVAIVWVLTLAALFALQEYFT